MHVLTRRCVVALVCALTAMLVAAPAQAAPIPAPKQYFGFELGTTGKLARFSKIQAYLKLIGDNSNRGRLLQPRHDDQRQRRCRCCTSPRPRTWPRSTRSSPPTTASRTRAGLSEEDAKELAARPHPGLLPRGGHALDRGRPGAGDPEHRAPARDRALARDQPDPQRDADHRAAGRQPGRLAPGHGLLQRDRQDGDRRGRIRTSTTTTRATTTTATGCSSRSSSPSCGSASSSKYKPVVEHILHQAGATGPRCGCRRTTTASPPPVTRSRMQSDATRSAWTSAAACTAEDKKGVKYRGRLLRDHGHGRHPELPHLRGARRCSCSRPPRCATSRTRTRARTASRSATQVQVDAQPAARTTGTTWTLEQMLDYARDRHVPGAARWPRSPSAGRWTTSTASRATRIASTDGPCGVRPPGRPAGPVRGLRHAQGARAVAGGDRPRDGASSPPAARRYPAGSYVINTRQPLGKWAEQIMGNRPYPERQELRDLPAADAVLARRRTTCR